MKGKSFLGLEAIVTAIQPHGPADRMARLLVTLVFLYWNAVEGSVFETEYSPAFVRWYPIPLWRLLLLSAVIVGALWCPSVGIMLAFAFFFYSMDMEVTMERWG